jgi:hypothetical protein
LANGSSYQHAMADRHLPDAFATDLTGVYATDPHYGSNLIAIMKLYNLYRYSAPDAQPVPSPAAPSQVATPQAPAPQAPASQAPASQAPASQAPASQAPAAPGGQQAGTANINGTGSQAGTFGLGGVVSVSGQATQRGSAVQGRSASQRRSASQNTSASQRRSASQNTSASQGRSVSRATAEGRGGGATIPGILDAYESAPASSVPTYAAPTNTGPTNTAPTNTGPTNTAPTNTGRIAAAAHARAPQSGRPAARVAPRRAAASQARESRYASQIPQVVTTAFVTTAKAPLSRAEPLYDDVASRTGIRWELLAACDWMQCQAKPRYSPVYGEKLGTVNAGGTVYRTKSEALGQCASDLIELAMAVYWIDITARRPLSVRDLAKVFAAFRWGGLLKLHGISAMEFPYSVAGLTEQHVKMRWPDIKDPNAPDKPGTRFKMPFGAVPAVLCLGYPAIA